MLFPIRVAYTKAWEYALFETGKQHIVFKTHMRVEIIQKLLRSFI